MAYSTIAQVRVKNSSLLTAGAISDDDITSCIQYADDIINGMAGGSYTVPFAAPPDIIKGISVDIAASKALEQVIGTDGSDNEPNQADRLYSRAMELLEKIARGELTLNISSNVASGKVTVKSSTYNTTPKFLNWNPQDPSTYQDFT